MHTNQSSSTTWLKRGTLRAAALEAQQLAARHKRPFKLEQRSGVWGVLVDNGPSYDLADVTPRFNTHDRYDQVGDELPYEREVEVIAPQDRCERKFQETVRVNRRLEITDRKEALRIARQRRGSMKPQGDKYIVTWVEYNLA